MSRRPKSVRKLRGELLCWWDRLYSCWVAVDKRGVVWTWEWRRGRSGEWLEDFETYGPEALRRVSRQLARLAR